MTLTQHQVADDQHVCSGCRLRTGVIEVWHPTWAVAVVPLDSPRTEHHRTYWLCRDCRARSNGWDVFKDVS